MIFLLQQSSAVALPLTWANHIAEIVEELMVIEAEAREVDKELKEILKKRGA